MSDRAHWIMIGILVLCLGAIAVTHYSEVKLSKVERAIKACELGDWSACDWLDRRYE